LTFTAWTDTIQQAVSVEIVDHCAAGRLVNGRGSYCMQVGGQQIDTAVATAFLATCTPAGVQAALAAAQRLEADHDAALAPAAKRSSGLAMKPRAPNAATERSMPRIAWSPVASSASGRSGCKRWLQPKRSWPPASTAAPAGSAQKSAC
jgi:hypothetical protein